MQNNRFFINHTVFWANKSLQAVATNSKMETYSMLVSSYLQRLFVADCLATRPHVGA